jgi:hypothetical protein
VKLSASTICLIICIVAVGCATAAENPQQSKGIGSSDVKRLALQALTPSQKELPGIEVYDRSNAGRCIVFEALFNNPQPGSVHVDFLLVDPQTGEVWHGPNPPCELVSSPSLRSAQKKIRAKYKISEADAERAPFERVCCVK